MSPGSLAFGHEPAADGRRRRRPRHRAGKGRASGALRHAAILVEGASDRRAIAALAERQGRNLESEGVEVIATTGVTNFSKFLALLGPRGHGVALTGLCDEGERADLVSALSDAGIRSGEDPLESLGFFVCVRDLEDELIRALGADAMLAILEGQGHLRRFHSFQSQPAQRHKTIEQQLWRWLGNHKIEYAPLMVGALAISQVPGPLAGALASI